MRDRSDLQNLPRLLGTYPPGDGPAGTAGAKEGGKLLILVGGLHGNEPAGVRAILRFFEELEESALPIDGRVVGITGNARALREGGRFLVHDLNRLWTEETVRLDPGLDGASGAPIGESVSGSEGYTEEVEQQEILRELRRVLDRAPGCAVLLDLHSTSAEGPPFAIMADTLQNRSIASALRIPIVLGLEELVQGTLLAWFSEMGHCAVCIEGGQNELDSTVDHHLASIWITLVTAGLLAESEVSNFAALRERLAATVWGLPEFCEIKYRYGVPPEGKFEMEAGFTNFHLVSQGTALARESVDGETKRIRCPHDGQLIMPRYQGQGADGFFIGREIPSWALRFSTVIRYLRLSPLLRLLPGVRRNPDRVRSLIVDRRIARWRTLEILHLFGYRRCGREGYLLYFLRRPDRFS